jgi:hypothetical protein
MKKMSEDRITYRNLEEIFVIEIENENIEVGTIEGLPEKYYPDPFNKYVVIRNLYKYPDRVKAYAEACQYTNHQTTTAASPAIRSYAPMTGVFMRVVAPALNEAFKRKIIPQHDFQDSIELAIFSYYTPQSIEYHLCSEPHMDGESWIPLYRARPSAMPSSTDKNWSIQSQFKSIAGTLYLDETFGTELFLNKHTSHYYSDDTGRIYGTQQMEGASNVGVYPEGTDSCYEPLVNLGGEYNSIFFYYDTILHRPNYSAASDGDLKHGRLTQNIWFNDITEDEY